MAVVEDAATVLESFVQDVANLPAEIAHLLEEIQAKDKIFQECRSTIIARDTSIQKFIRINGSLAHNPKEEIYSKAIMANYDRAQAVQEEKVALSEKAGTLIDRHLRRLDVKIRDLQTEGAIPLDPPLPSLLHPSPANRSIHPLSISTSSNQPLHPISSNATSLLPSTTIANSDLARLAHPGPGGSARTHSPLTGPLHQRGGSSTTASFPFGNTTAAGSSSAPTTPAASGPLSQQRQGQRESSAGATDAKRRRLNPHLGSLPTTSSGLARTSSLGPGTPKGGAVGTGIVRAGSAGPRSAATSGIKKSATGSLTGRKMAPHQLQMRRKLGNKLHSQMGPGGIKKFLGKKNKPTASDDPNQSGAIDGADSEKPREQGSAGEESDVKRSGSVSASTDKSAAKGKGKGGRSKPKSAATKTEPRDDDDDDDEMGEPSSPPSTASDEEGVKARPSFPHSHRHSNSLTSLGDEDGDMAGDLEAEGEDHRKYCTCRNVSYGNMVACDNNDCPYEWFHWQCVGMTKEPGGEWFCNECRAKLGL